MGQDFSVPIKPITRLVLRTNSLARSQIRALSLRIKGGPEPPSFEDLCLVNVSVKYFSKLFFGTIQIQPELKYLKPILEDFTS